MPDPANQGAASTHWDLLARRGSRSAGLIKTKSEIEAEELATTAREAGATPIALVVPGARVTLQGKLRSVSLRPLEGVPATVADLYDGTGHLEVVWLGRRRIRGIEPGRVIQVAGRVNSDGRHRRLFNPRYTLLPATEAQA